MRVKTKMTMALLVLMIGILPAAISLAYPPPGAVVTVEDWTYFAQSDHDADAYFNLLLRWTDDDGTHEEWVPAFCLDSGIYWKDSPDMVVVPSDSPSLPVYAQDENLDQINYLMSEWYKGTWPDATWAEVQWVIWHYSDQSDPTGGGVYPPKDTAVVNQIIADIDDTDLSNFNGPYLVQILDPGDGTRIDDQNERQMTFFVIPEVPLGTITSILSMVGGFLYSKKK